MRVWRFRKCPSCGAVQPAGELVQLDLGSNWARVGASRCQCPACGHVDERAAFKVVRLQRQELERKREGAKWWAA